MIRAYLRLLNVKRVTLEKTRRLTLLKVGVEVGAKML